MTILQDIVAAVGWQTRVTENFRSVAPAGLYGINPATTSGLTLGYLGGEFNGVTVANGTVALTASATNYVVAHRTTGAVTAATTTTNWLDTTTYLQLYQFVAGASTFTIATTSDKRQAFGGTGSGGGGSVAGSTTQVQYNNAGAFGAASNFTYAANTLSVPNITLTGLALTAASATGGAGLRVPHGAAPTAPVDGDLWSTTAGLYARVNGATVGPIGVGSGVTSVDAANGVETTTGAAITATGTVRANSLVNAQTGTVYTVLTGDRGKLLTFANAGTVAVTQPQATSTFGAGWFADYKNLGPGTVTITPTTSTVDGVATLVLTAGQSARMVSDGTNYQSLKGAPSGSALSNWTESVNASAPNGTVPAVRFLATNAATDVDAVISPKGTGALLASTPDNAAAGGNKRGTNAVDLQTQRNVAADVASGANSGVLSGRFNRATGGQAVVVGGSSNIASNTGSVAAGLSSDASGAQAVAMGNAVVASATGAAAFGSNNTASGIAAFISGSQSTSAGDYSSSRGFWATGRSVYGAHAVASGQFASAGDAQVREIVMRRNTTDATASAITSNNAAASAINQLGLPTGAAMAFRGDVVAYKNSGGDCAMWSVVGLAKNVSGTFSLVGTPTVTLLFNDAGAAAWTLAITADNTNKAVTATVTGAAATSIKWVGNLVSVESTG